eukprot:3710822-Prymnesium_polylepis.2
MGSGSTSMPSSVSTSKVGDGSSSSAIPRSVSIMRQILTASSEMPSAVSRAWPGAASCLTAHLPSASGMLATSAGGARLAARLSTDVITAADSSSAACLATWCFASTPEVMTFDVTPPGISGALLAA